MIFFNFNLQTDKKTRTHQHVLMVVLLLPKMLQLDK